MSEISSALRVLCLSAGLVLAVQAKSQDAPVAIKRNWTGWTLNASAGGAVVGHGIKPQNKISGMPAVPADQFAYVAARAEIQLMRHLGPKIFLGAGASYLHTSSELFNGGIGPSRMPTSSLVLRGLRGVGVVEVPFFCSSQVSTSGVLSLGVQQLGGVLPGLVENPTFYGALAMRVSVLRKRGNMVFFELNVEQATFESEYRKVILDNRVVGVSISVGYRLGRLMLKPV